PPSRLRPPRDRPLRAQRGRRAPPRRRPDHPPRLGPLRDLDRKLQNRLRPGTVQADVLAYVVKRILWAGVLFLAITAVTYILFFVLPVQKQQAVRRTEFAATDVRHDLNINGPVYSEYAKFLSRTIHGN